jgi:hypothetical protein
VYSLWISQVLTSTKYTPMCDVYSWAICMWEVWSRRIPFTCDHGELPGLTTRFKGDMFLW